MKVPSFQIQTSINRSADRWAEGELVVPQPLHEPVTLVDQRDRRAGALGGGQAGVPGAQDHDVGVVITSSPFVVPAVSACHRFRAA
jgi:hypothetical protein